MSIWKYLRYSYIKTTSLTGGYKGETSKLLSFYKFWSFFYDCSISFDPSYRKNLEKMIKMVVSKNDSILEIGSGTGLGTLYAAQIAKNVTAIDISLEMLKKCNRKIKKKKLNNVNLILGNYPDKINGNFDAIISSFALVHFRKEKRNFVYESIYNHLKQGGYLGLFTAQGEIASAFDKLEETREALEDVGFINVRIKDVDDIYRIITAQK